MSTLQDAFSRFLSDRPDAFAAPSEAAYKAHWQTLGEQDPLALAFAGGAIADRLAWVFAAAYQGAVRACVAGARHGAPRAHRSGARLADGPARRRAGGGG